MKRTLSVRVIGRGGVVKRKKRPGQQLDREQREQNAAQSEEPSGSGRQGLVQHDVDGAAIPGAGVDPLQESLHSRTSTDESDGSIRASIVASGRGGGPATTAPSAPYTPP